MRKVLSLFVLSSLLLMVGFASAITEVTGEPVAKCGGLDLCTWTTNTGYADVGLPLGSQDIAGCGLNYNTFWAVGSNQAPSIATATCVFNGDYLAEAMLYLSVDNDVVSCTLNGEPVGSTIMHEGCAPADPLNGESIDLSSELGDGTNTLVCTVKDRGTMTHFDACVIGTPEDSDVPEFGVIVATLTVMGALGAFFVVRRK